jgi:hypothetical protein
LNAAGAEPLPESARPLIGRWSLLSWEGRDDSGALVSHGGDRPLGELIYLPSGRMAVQIQWDERRPLGSRELDAGDEPARAEALSTYNAYAGTFSLPADGVVVHHVELSLRPDQVGMEKRRDYTLDGEVLTLRTQPVRSGDSLASSELRWQLAERL